MIKLCLQDYVHAPRMYDLGSVSLQNSLEILSMEGAVRSPGNHLVVMQQNEYHDWSQGENLLFAEQSLRLNGVLLMQMKHKNIKFGASILLIVAGQLRETSVQLFARHPASIIHVCTASHPASDSQEIWQP